MNNSPWIKQLNRTRPIAPFSTVFDPDVAIIGAGIAGVTTAYYLLKETDKKVLLIDAGKVAHGATGHNAGYVIADFERTIKSITDEYGLDKAKEGYEALQRAWPLFEGIISDAKLHTPLVQFTGYVGFAEQSEILEVLEDMRLLEKAGFPQAGLQIAGEYVDTLQIPKQYEEFYSVVPQSSILALLETADRSFIAVKSQRIGCTNSALLSEELVGYLLTTYPDRFSLVEEAPVSHLFLETDHALLSIKESRIRAERVVMCTNGFEKIIIVNRAGENINSVFHHTVSGTIGYMAGYLEPIKAPPTGLIYKGEIQAPEDYDGLTKPIDPYFYLTRRPYEDETKGRHNLVSVGGPEKFIEDSRGYLSQAHEYLPQAKELIDSFVHKTFTKRRGETEYEFLWHGLMGYTTSGLRLVGPEPRNPILMYNLGCNGIGILPSVMGSKKIADFVNEKVHHDSIFDPK